MTDKKQEQEEIPSGTRVKVEFEGIMIGRSNHGIHYKVRVGDTVETINYVPINSCTPIIPEFPFNQGDLVRWDGEDGLSATGHTHAFFTGDLVSSNGDMILKMKGNDFLIVSSSQCTLVKAKELVKIEEEPDWKRIKVGSQVILGEHKQIKDKNRYSKNWTTAMDEYVGRSAVVTRVYVEETFKCPSAEVEICGMANGYEWRRENMTLVKE